MKKYSKRVRIFTLMFALLLFLNSNIMTAHAAILMPGMTLMEDGRVKIRMGSGGPSAFIVGTDSTGREWVDNVCGYPYCYYKEPYEHVMASGNVVIMYNYYLEYYLGDFIKTHDESEWPDFVIKGSDGIPFYYGTQTYNRDNYDNIGGVYNYYYVKYCYDEASGWWILDKAYKGPYRDGWGTGRYVETVAIEDLIKETKSDIENGKTVNGTPEDPVPPQTKDKVIDTDNPPSEDPVNPPAEITDPYADINTLGATVTLGTDCIKVKKNNAPQKPMPKSVKIGKTALKKNKTFTVSYEKYTDGWNKVDAVTEEGIYRLVVTGTNGYEGICTKRLYVTGDKTIKAMSSVSVKVNKMPYTGEAITAGVIKPVKVGKRILVEGTDYTVSYANNTEIGTAQVILTAKEGSGLLGTKTVNFKITGNPMSKAKVKGLSSIAYEPDKDLVQDMSKVTLAYGTDTLKEGADFEVSYANNTKAGTAKITFTGKGRYNGKVTKSFKITKAALNENMLDGTSKSMKLAYTGKALKPEVTLKYDNTVLKAGTDYTLSYSNNVKVSTDIKPAQITVKGKGNYAGSFKIDFTITSDIDNHNGKADPKNAGFAVESAPDEESAVEDSVMDVESKTEDSTIEDDTVSDDSSVSDDNTAADDSSVSDDNTAAEDGMVADDNATAEDVSVADDNIATDDNTIVDKESTPEEEFILEGETILEEEAISEEESVSEEGTDNETINEETTDQEVAEEEQSQRTAQTEET